MILKETARALHIHINTFHYRLKRIEDLTRLNPRKLADLVTMHLAVSVLDKHTKTFRFKKRWPESGS